MVRRGGAVTDPETEQAIWDGYREDLLYAVETEDTVVLPDSCGEIDVLATVRLTGDAPTLVVRYQPCDDRRCLPPVERTIGLEISHTIPSDYRLALQAMNKGRPVVLETGNELATAFKGFARQLAGVPDEPKEEKARPGSLFGRLAPKKA